MHPACVLGAPRLYFGCTPGVFWVHPACVLGASGLCFGSTQGVFWMHRGLCFGCTRLVFWVHPGCVLGAPRVCIECTRLVVWMHPTLVWGAPRLHTGSIFSIRFRVSGRFCRSVLSIRIRASTCIGFCHSCLWTRMTKTKARSTLQPGPHRAICV